MLAPLTVYPEVASAISSTVTPDARLTVPALPHNTAMPPAWLFQLVCVPLVGSNQQSALSHPPLPPSPSPVSRLLFAAFPSGSQYSVLTALTVIQKVCGSDSSTPPPAVPPSSPSVTDTTAVPVTPPATV